MKAWTVVVVVATIIGCASDAGAQNSNRTRLVHAVVHAAAQRSTADTTVIRPIYMDVESFIAAFASIGEHLTEVILREELPGVTFAGFETIRVCPERSGCLVPNDGVHLMLASIRRAGANYCATVVKNYNLPRGAVTVSVELLLSRQGSNWMIQSRRARSDAQPLVRTQCVGKQD